MGNAETISLDMKLHSTASSERADRPGLTCEGFMVARIGGGHVAYCVRRLADEVPCQFRCTNVVELRINATMAIV